MKEKWLELNKLLDDINRHEQYLKNSEKGSEVEFHNKVKIQRLKEAVKRKMKEILLLIK